MIFKKLYLVVCLTIIAVNANAVTVEGDLRQGGLVLISYDPTEVAGFRINNERFNVSEDGFDYYPISRNAKKLSITTVFKNGDLSKETHKIKKQEYKTQTISGIKNKYVKPDNKNLVQIRKEAKLIRKSRQANSKKMFDSKFPEFIMPTEGEITGVFGSRRVFNGVEKSWHSGYDIANKEGAPIKAPLDGKVVLALHDSFYNGNLVVIDHGKKIYSIYAHMYAIMVEEGDFVKTGDTIGQVGSTGRSTGPHLHWGVYVSQKAIDPEFLLK